MQQRESYPGTLLVRFGLLPLVSITVIIVQTDHRGRSQILISLIKKALMEGVQIEHQCK